MEEHGDTVTVSAPNARSYVQFGLVRIEGAVREVYNPSYEPFQTVFGTGEKVYPLFTTKELSLMCRTQEPYTAVRFKYIKATYYEYDARVSRLVKREAELFSNDAVAFQHMVDVFRGVWMCSYDREPWVPKIPAPL